MLLPDAPKAAISEPRVRLIHAPGNSEFSNSDTKDLLVIALMVIRRYRPSIYSRGLKKKTSPLSVKAHAGGPKRNLSLNEN